ncbi:MAG: ATP-dependent Clp protease ATP-binding subunit ClpA [Treponema sp.]|nr:MAG: ATP-dependent Clp protease ATP-binding subunit ClpA [Treponema sp.]
MKVSLSTKSERVVDAALENAKTKNHEFVTPEHLLFEILGQSDIVELLFLCDTNVEALYFDVKEYLNNFIPVRKKINIPMQSLGFKSVISRAVLHCQSADKQKLEPADLLVSIYDEELNHASFLMRHSGIKRIKLLQAISYSKKHPIDILDRSLKNKIFPPNYKNIKEQIDELAVNRPSKIPGYKENIKEPGKQKRSILPAFTSNLTELAKEGKLGKIIGRQDEIDNTIQILCRKKKNNPIHIGEPGVGKTAITEGLAQRIIAKEVPDFLYDFEIFSLDMSSVIAGTKLRGDFEERLKNICNELIKHEKAILFIDEIHSLIGTGSGTNGGFDASNILKPFLTSGNLRCIGATTYDEYVKTFSKDKALSRRFQKIEIQEPSEESTFEILKGIQPDYELFHNIKYSDEALKHAVHLSNLYINERFLPDKAIDIIDEAGSQARIFNSLVPDEKKEIIEEAEIDLVVAKMAKIPKNKVSTDEREKLQNLEQKLSEKIFGQKEAVQSVSTAIKRTRAGLRAKNKSVANFLFVGPTGVGKTALANAIADELGIAIHRFDMSEYQEKHTVSRLIGSPPGYVGFEEGGLLTDAVRRAPHAVLLLDEIEKAHSSIFNVLLQIMDYATLTDNQGRKADFRNIILILTSNAGADQLGKPEIGFGGKTFSDSAITTAVENAFSPEFRNRLDSVITFHQLNTEAAKQIVVTEIKKLNNMLAEKGRSVKCDDNIMLYFVEKGYSREFGARNISRMIEKELITPLVDLILFDEIKEGETAKCTMSKSGELKITVEQASECYA